MMRLLDIRVGFFLAVRQVRHASIWTNILIVCVMLLTFLNLVAVSGILVGLIVGISNLYRQQQTGDVFISNLTTKNYIERSQDVITFARSLPQVDVVDPRYVAGGIVEANYKTHAKLTEKPNQTAANIIGVDPVLEESLSHLTSFIGEGSYLSPTGWDEIVIGSQLIDRYSFVGDLLPGISSLRDIYPGTTVRVTVNGVTREMTVKGILVTTANSPLASKVVMNGDQLRQMLGRDDHNVNQIAIMLKPGADPAAVRDLFLRSGIGDVARVQTYADAIPGGVSEIKDTFSQLGTAIGSIGLVVASITIFIVIFINAVTRRKFIGILKGIGISGEAIEVSYMFQSLFYAVIGSGLGLLVVYGFLVPYTDAHPIVLPISRAVIVAPLTDTMLRVALLVAATVIAGFIPARMIVRKNTLDSILGRNS